MDKEAEDSMRDDYDFSGSVRGKHHHFNAQAHTLEIYRPDGSVTVETIGATIELEPDVRKYFPNSEAVNEALRDLIELIPEESRKSA